MTLHLQNDMTRSGFYSVESLHGVHVVIAGPEPEGREVLTGVLTYCGALVTPVASADEALEVMRRIKADIIVVELVMPRHDGLWLIRQVRSLKPEDGAATRAIALRAIDDDREEQARGEGYDACVTMPVDPWALCRVVSNLVSTR